MRKIACACVLLIGCEGQFTAEGAAQATAGAAGALVDDSGGSAGDLVHPGASGAGGDPAVAGAGGRPNPTGGAISSGGVSDPGGAGASLAGGAAGSAGAAGSGPDFSCIDTAEKRERLCGATTGGGPCGAEWTCVSMAECLAEPTAGCPAPSACVAALVSDACG